MRSGVPLSVLRKEVLIEAGLSTDPGHAIATQEKITHLLNRTERIMAIREGWPTLMTEEEVTVAADAQYAALPTTISALQIREAHVQFGTEWLRLSHGITPEHRSIYNDTQRAVPAQRWEVAGHLQDQFEVWPIGAASQIILFSGQKKIGAMVNENDTCTLDGDVMVLRVAAEMLGRDRKEDAALKLDLARTLTNDILKLQGGIKDDPIDMTGRGANRRMLRPGIDYIPPGGA